MQDHGNGGAANKPPAPDSVEYRAQRVVLLELVVCPPNEGDRLGELVERLDLLPGIVDPAVAALEDAGLAERKGDIVRASAPANYFEYLWPVKP